MTAAEAPARPAAATDEGWRPSRADLVHACAEATMPSLVAQPIIDLSRGSVVGYEMLSRFPQGRPDAWFAAAAAHGMSAQLDARVMRRALALRAELPPNTFLTVNVEPHDLLDPAVQAVVTGEHDLSRLVVELTEHARVDLAGLAGPLRQLRDRGAVIAADDVGAGYAGLQALLALRPQIVKIDRSLVDGIDEDPAKQAVVRMLGELSSTMDAWVLAEGIERPEELVELLRLGVPLAQGYLLGRPGVGFVTDLPVGVRTLIADQVARQARRGTAAELMEVVPLLPHTPDLPAGSTDRVAVEVDSWGRPVALVMRDGRRVWRPLIVQAGEEVAVLARRVAGHGDVPQPVVVVDGNGRARGLVRPRRLLARLAEPVAP